MCVNVFVLVNLFEDVACCRAVRQLKCLKINVFYTWSQFIFEIFDFYFTAAVCSLTKRLLEFEFTSHNFLSELIKNIAVVVRLTE